MTMSHNVRIDALLRLEACDTEHYGSPLEARQCWPALDTRHFSPRMQISVTGARFTCQRAKLRKQYVTRALPPTQATSEPAVPPSSTRQVSKKKQERKPEPVGPDAAQRERDSGVMVVSARQLALMENRVFRGEFYAFLMTHSLQGKKTDTHIGYSTNPILEIHKHNTLQINDRTTNTAAPHWRADIVIGPVHCLRKVILLCEDWVRGTRGKDSKRKRALVLARMYGVDIYSCAVPGAPLGRYLSQHAPRAYQEAYRALQLSQSR